MEDTQHLRKYDRATLRFIEFLTLHHSHNLLSEPLHCPLQHRSRVINKTISVEINSKLSFSQFR